MNARERGNLNARKDKNIPAVRVGISLLSAVNVGDKAGSALDEYRVTSVKRERIRNGYALALARSSFAYELLCGVDNPACLLKREAVSRRDAGAGQQIVELVEEQLFPEGSYIL